MELDSNLYLSKTHPLNRKSLKFFTIVPEFLKTQNNWFKHDQNPLDTFKTVNNSPLNKVDSIFSPQATKSTNFFSNLNKLRFNPMIQQKMGILKTNNEVMEVNIKRITLFKYRF